MALRKRARKLAEVGREVHNHPAHLAIAIAVTFVTFGALVWSAINWVFDDPGEVSVDSTGAVEPPSGVLTAPFAKTSIREARRLQALVPPSDQIGQALELGSLPRRSQGRRAGSRICGPRRERREIPRRQ